MTKEAEHAQQLGHKWTPTLVFLAPDGSEQYRFVGYLPQEQFLARLKLGLGMVLYGQERYADAAEWFREVADDTAGECAAEARYWLGVALYKEGGGDVEPIKEHWMRLRSEHPNSEWTAKASFIWS